MAFVFRVIESEANSQTWLVLLGNGRYSTSTKRGKEGTWSAPAEAMPAGEYWGRGTNQIQQAWSTPVNVATNANGTYAVTKPSGAISGDGKQYVYNTGEDPPVGNWNGITAGAFNQVIYDDNNSRFVRLRHNTVQDKTYMAFSNNGVDYNSEFVMVTGQYNLYHATISGDTWVGVYQNGSSDPSGLKGNRILVNSGSDFPNDDTYVANVPSGGHSRISRPHYGGGTWFAGYTGGLLKSTNGGADWSEVSLTHNGTACRIQGVAYSTGTSTWLAVGTVGTDVNGGTAIILRSTDGGTSWTSVKTGGIANGGFFSVATSHDSIWLVGGQNREVYRSINDGVSWTGPISTIYNDTAYSGGNQHYDVVAIHFETNKNV